MKMTIEYVKLLRKYAKESYDEDTIALCNSWLNLKKLAKYVAHDYLCNSQSLIPQRGRGCDCGLEQLRKKIEDENEN